MRAQYLGGSGPMRVISNDDIETICSPPGGRAGDLPGQDVETLLSADTSRPIGQSYLGGVCRGGSELSVH